MTWTKHDQEILMFNLTWLISIGCLILLFFLFTFPKPFIESVDASVPSPDGKVMATPFLLRWGFSTASCEQDVAITDGKPNFKSPWLPFKTFWAQDSSPTVCSFSHHDTLVLKWTGNRTLLITANEKPFRGRISSS